MFDFFLFNELQKGAARHESSSQRSSHSSYGSTDSYMECDCDCDCGIDSHDSFDRGSDSYDSCDCDDYSSCDCDSGCDW